MTTPIEEMQAKLQVAQARRAAAAEALQVKNLEAQIRAAEREAEDDEFAAALCARLDGELGIDFDFLRFGDFLIPCRRPERLVQDAWNKKVAKEGKLPVDEIRNHVKKCLVPNEGPDGMKEAQAHFDKVTAIFTDAPIVCLNLVAELAQGGNARRKGK